MKKSFLMIVLGVIFLISGFYFLQKKEEPEIVTIIQPLPIKVLEEVDDEVARQLLNRIVWVKNNKKIRKMFFSYPIKNGILFFWRNSEGGWLEGYIEKFKTPKIEGIYFYGQPKIKIVGGSKLELKYTIHPIFSVTPLIVLYLIIGIILLGLGLFSAYILKKHACYPF